MLLKQVRRLKRVEKDRSELIYLIGRNAKFVGQGITEELRIRQILTAVMPVYILDDRCTENGVAEALDGVRRALGPDDLLRTVGDRNAPP